MMIDGDEVIYYFFLCYTNFLVSRPNSSHTYDVIVVGMGPAGASASYNLSQGGLSVLGFDKYTHPRYKVCGGGLSARIATILPADFLSVVEKSVHHLQFSYGTQESFLIESP